MKVTKNLRTRNKVQRLDVQYTDSTVATIWHCGSGRAEHMKAG